MHESEMRSAISVVCSGRSSVDDRPKAEKCVAHISFQSAETAGTDKSVGTNLQMCAQWSLLRSLCDMSNRN